jgi:DNA-binding MarR family transcriptional regulator
MQLKHETVDADLAQRLLPVLMGLKAWTRQVSHQQLSPQASTSLAALGLLERYAPVRVSELAEVARVDTSVVSRLAKSLEQNGLVERSSDPSDGRAHRLQLSDEGRRVLAEGRARMARLVADRLAGWSRDDLERLTGDLTRLLGDLSTEPTDPGTPGA